ncbi:uncharacterized protein DS421_4g129360 [Arachis hypogaea]|nr:uncharacterized protein DS421_4g129360 [Arachis hypogaea]
MSLSSQSSCVTSSQQASHAVMSTTKKRVHDEMVEQNQKKLLIENPLIPLAREHLNIEDIVRLKPCFDVTGRYGWNSVAKFRGSNVGIGGDELVRGHHNKETKNCLMKVVAKKLMKVMDI